jgi:hypothetical protein
MQVCDMEWEIPISAQPLTSTRPTSSPTVQRKVSKKRHRRIFSSSKVEPPATFTLAKEEHKRQSFINTANPTLATGIKRDWTVVQKAWWDAILLMQSNPSVVRVALELRIMGDSQILLAPQRGNVLGTCSIEILSNFNTPKDVWKEFCQRLTEKWVNYVDSTGRRVRARPHWCKQWEFLEMSDENGRKIGAVEWMRRVGYKDEIPKFLESLKKIGEGAGFTLEDLRARFGNQLLESIFWDGPDPVPVSVKADVRGFARFKKWLSGIF